MRSSENLKKDLEEKEELPSDLKENVNKDVPMN